MKHSSLMTISSPGMSDVNPSMKRFNSKLLLFGEYGVMVDAMALSIPFPKFSGTLNFDEDNSHTASTSEICKFFEHLQIGESFLKLHFQFNLGSLEHDLEHGLYFNSNIPQQYGVGSSGALVAALFSKYALPFITEITPTPELLKSDFALLESYFHGKSSGIDPLISYLNEPLLLDSKKTIQTIQLDLPKTNLSIALIDTKTTGATGPLVELFVDQFNSPEFAMVFEREFIPANNGCIHSFINDKKVEFFSLLEQLILFQLQYFRKMIPMDFHSIISNALNDKVFIKLLGSGGGGFLLAFADSEPLLNWWADKEGIRLLMVT